MIKSSKSHGSLASLGRSQQSSGNLSALIESEAGEGACPIAFLRQKSSFFFEDGDNERDISIDGERLQRALAEAGEYAYGIDAVEVWVLDEATGWLSRPREGSWWTNPYLARNDNTALRRLDDPTELGYVEPQPTMPGVDLAGILFAESPLHTAQPENKAKDQKVSDGSARDNPDLSVHSVKYNLRSSNTLPLSMKNMSKSFDSRRQTLFSGKFSQTAPSVDMSKSFDSRRQTRVSAKFNQTPSGDSPVLQEAPQEQPQTVGQASEPNNKQETIDQVIKFRDIYSLILDPDTPKSARLTTIGQAGFTQAAGVPFQFGWHTGIVIYYTRCATAKENVHLNSIPNQVYMVYAADVIGAVLGSADARRAANALKLQASKNELADEDEQADQNGANLQELTKQLGKDLSKTYRPSLLRTLRLKVSAWWSKCHGGQLQPPPAMPTEQALWSFVGVFCALVIILTFNELVLAGTDGDQYVLLGPIGALMTLQYGLTQAPASQPRNVLFGQIVAGVVALPISYLPIPTALRQAIGPALAISLMAKLGVIHPPAGGASIILASGTKAWSHYGLMVGASALSLIPAILINNLSQKRQYPTYWGIFRDFNNAMKLASNRK